MSRPDKAVQAHVRRIENGANRGNDRDVVAEHRKVLHAQRLGAHERQRRRGRGGLESDGEKQHVLFGIGLRQLQRVGRRVDDAHVHPARLMLQRAAVRAGHAHHVAERGEDHVVAFSHGQPIVDPPHRQDAHGAAGPVDQFDIGRQQVLQTEAIDGVRVPAADLHQPVVPLGIVEAANLRHCLMDQLRFAKFVDKSHHSVFLVNFMAPLSQRRGPGAAARLTGVRPFFRPQESSSRPTRIRESPAAPPRSRPASPASASGPARPAR